MTELLEKAVEVVRRLASEAQDDITRVMLHLANEGEPEAIESTHFSAILESLAQADRRELASDAEVETALRRFR